MRRTILFFFFFMLVLVCSSLANAQSPTPNAPPGFAVTTVVGLRDGLFQPTAFAFLPDGQNRILIAEKSGLLKLFAKGVVYGRPVLDLRAEVNEFVDRGLVGLAVDPNYMQNGYIYLAYVYDAPVNRQMPRNHAQAALCATPWSRRPAAGATWPARAARLFF